jgi:3-hydroxybutyryl-CoA dehydrogenase
METFAVIGAGTMGNGIANLAARSGLEVIMCQVRPEFLRRGLQAIDSSLNRDLTKGRLSKEEKNRIIRRIRTVTELEAVREADFVVEAIIEDTDAKLAVMAELDEITGPEVILASNTSSISITKLAAATRRPDRCIDMHFYGCILPTLQIGQLARR